MTLTYEVMRLARTGGQRMVVYQAAPGTPDEEAMLRLESGDAVAPAPAAAGNGDRPPRAAVSVVPAGRRPHGTGRVSGRSGV